MKHVMLDLETMGTEPGAPVVAIGACRFEMDDDSAITDCFHQAISLQSCMDAGLSPSASTITWWLTNEEITPQARAIFADGAMNLHPALGGFATWYYQDDCEIWGNSAAFDLGVLAAAYKAAGQRTPWGFWNERCYRTVKNLPKAIDIKLERLGTHHNALDDAISQAHHLRAIWKTLGLS